MTEKFSRILGIDPGKKRIGLAIGDSRLKIATGYRTLGYGGKKNFIGAIKDIITDEQIDLVVIGLPINMDGSEGESANFSRSLAELIKRDLNLNVEFMDERLTTEQAKRQIHQAQQKVGKSKEKIDMLSAVIILQSYLDQI